MTENVINKQPKVKTCWFLVEETTDYYFSEEIKRVFKAKPSKKKLVETLKDKSLDFYQFTRATKEEFEGAIQEILDGKEVQRLSLREEQMY